MFYTNIVNDVTAWIESNKYHNLKIDEVVNKSGYSRTHLQRFFKEKTSMNIGTYSRLRRLSAAAIALRITTNPVSDLARSFGFDSAATFISAFKKQFGVTPACFRARDIWPFENMVPRYDYLAAIDELECRVVKEVQKKPFMRTLSLEEITPNIEEGTTHSVLIGSSNFYEEFQDNKDVALAYSLCGTEPDTVKKRTWIAVTLSWPVDELQKLHSLLYAGLLPSLGVVRPRAPDMMKIIRQDNSMIITEYLVPCIEMT
ncbi:helix-turn-helix domain-containing protein [Escherichia coli]|nr:helix-turn-helix domain-containing protein [Escherichia coli]ELJ0190788.1 helix-turn-helix domain-containing protein [Escherichia coli]